MSFGLPGGPEGGQPLGSGMCSEQAEKYKSWYEVKVLAETAGLELIETKYIIQGMNLCSSYNAGYA